MIKRRLKSRLDAFDYFKKLLQRCLTFLVASWQKVHELQSKLSYESTCFVGLPAQRGGCELEGIAKTSGMLCSSDGAPLSWQVKRSGLSIPSVIHVAHACTHPSPDNRSDSKMTAEQRELGSKLEEEESS